MIDNDNQNISNILIKLENFEKRIITLEQDNIILKKENEKLKENFNDKINISIDNTIINNKNNENEITVVVFCFIYL